MTYFMNQKVTVTFVVGLTPKGHGVIGGPRDLHNDHKVHGDLCGRSDLVYDPKNSWGH